MTSAITATPLTDAEYHQLTAAVLAQIETHLDRWLQADVVDIDGQRTGGMLEMRFPNRTHMVVNTQPPLHELWLAAKAGGYHYKYQAGRWLDTRDGSEFFESLSRHASAQSGVALLISAPE